MQFEKLGLRRYHLHVAYSSRKDDKHIQLTTVRIQNNFIIFSKYIVPLVASPSLLHSPW